MTDTRAEEWAEYKKRKNGHAYAETKSALCRLNAPAEVETALTALWQDEYFRLAA